MRAKVGELSYLHFVIFDTDGVTPLSGQAGSCTYYLSKNGAATGEAVTIAEIGGTGHYKASVTLLSAANYHLTVTCPDGRVVGDSFEAEIADLDDLSTDLTFLSGMFCGRWIIDEATGIMSFYKADNVTLLRQFQLKDRDGNAGYIDPFERTVL